jgi:hypothetical protein
VKTGSGSEGATSEGAAAGQPRVTCIHGTVWVVEIASRRIVRRPCAQCAAVAAQTSRAGRATG